MDDALQDLNAAMRDMEGFMDTAMGKRLESTNRRVPHRQCGHCCSIVIAEMMAIY